MNNINDIDSSNVMRIVQTMAEKFFMSKESSEEYKKYLPILISLICDELINSAKSNDYKAVLVNSLSICILCDFGLAMTSIA
jgi:hypothetical protein